MKKRFLKIVIGIVFVCILFVGFLYANNNIGMTSTNLETDIRSSQKIKDDWTIDGSVSNTMAAYISYSQDMSDHTFSVYVNRPGLSFGYFFRGGGTLSGIQRGIVEFTVEGYNERAFISMNQQQVQQLEIDDGNTIQVVDIDRNKPFAIVLPINAGNITFYDVIQILWNIGIILFDKFQFIRQTQTKAEASLEMFPPCLLKVRIYNRSGAFCIHRRHEAAKNG